MISSERLYWNASKTKLVKEGDKEAAFLFCTTGQAIQEEHHALIAAITETIEEAGEETIKEAGVETNKEDVSGKNKSKKTTKFGGGK